MGKGCKHFKIGDILTNNEGYNLQVVDYHGANNVLIRWLDCGTEEITASGNISRGMIRYLNKRSVFGVGYLGYGRFVPGEKRLEHGQQRLPSHLHRHWRHVLERTVADRDIARYEDCKIVSEWHNLQNFCNWAIEQPNHNSKESNGRYWAIDKDIVCKGNRIYGPEFCVFVPNEVNVFFTKKEIGNAGLPGVNIIHAKNVRWKTGYIARCTTPGKPREYLGFYDTPEEAFAVYKEAKEKAARVLAGMWEGRLDHRVIESLHKFTVDC